MKPLASLALATFAALGALPSATPILAAQADIDLLKSYVGDWRGRGTAMFSATGKDETVVCRMSIRDSARTKVAFDGRCSLAGRTISVAGTVAWIENANRYEAIMSSVASFQGVAVGQRDGDDIAFNLIDRNAEDGTEHRIDASLQLEGDHIQLDFEITNLGNGEVTTAQVPFSQS